VTEIKTEPESSPLEHRFAVDDMTADAADIAISAPPEARARLARFLGLVALDRLDVRARVRRRPDRVCYELRLAVSADVTQSCVVSLEPLTARVDETMTLVYTPNPDATDEVGPEVEIDVESEDPPERLVDGQIDIGSLVVELLALGLDPYARKPGAEVPADYAGADTGGSGAGTGPRPFAALARLARES